MMYDLEVYKVITWLPALSTFMNRTKKSNPENLSEDYDFIKNLSKRYEFIGNIAENEIREKYINKSVAHLFSYGESNPFKYIWGKKSVINS